MLYRIAFSLLFAFTILQAMGQTGFTVGYHYGYANPREINRVLHANNLRNETILTDKMPAAHWFKGYSTGAQIKGFGRAGMEIMWVGRETTVSAQGKDAAGAIVQRDIKITSY